MSGNHIAITPDASQLAAIKARDLGIRIIAPAGTGKTFTVIQHVIDRIQRKEIEADRILMLSFDDSTLASYQSHLSLYLQGKDIPNLTSFSDLSGRLYRQHIRDDVHVSKKLNPYFQRIADEQGTIPLLEEASHPVTNYEAFFATKRYGIPASTHISAKEREHFPSWFTTVFLDLPCDYFDGRETDRAIMLEDFLDRYRAYQESLVDPVSGATQYEAIDIELALASILRKQTKDGRRIRRDIQALYDLIVVDEAQDISRLDAVLLNRILRSNTPLVIAGDDDQTIQEATFADSRFLRLANELFQRPFQDYPLDVNYRTPGRILDRAQELIATNDVRRVKPVVSSRPDSGILELHRVTRPEERTAVLTNIISTIRHRPPSAIEWRDMVVLVPDDEKARVVATHLRTVGVPVARVKTASTSATPRDEVQVLSLRKAKGRGWKAVIVPWCSDDDIPSESARLEDDIDGERRLFYVTMTRAAEELHLIYVQASTLDEVKRSASGTVYGMSGASRFLFEAGILQDHATRLKLDPRIGTLPDKARKDFQRFDRCLASDDPEGAISAGFNLVEWGLNQLQHLDPTLDLQRLKPIDQIRELAARDREFDREWKPTLHRWRMARNTVVHSDSASVSREDPRVVAAELGAKLPAFLDFVARRRSGSSAEPRVAVRRDMLAQVAQPPSGPDPNTQVEPTPVASKFSPSQESSPDTPSPHRANRLQPVPTADIMRIAFWLARGGIDPTSGKAIRTVPIHPRSEGLEYLPLQLALILADVPFHIRKPFRYTESPVFGRFCATVCSQQIPKELRHQAQRSSPDHLARHDPAILSLLSDVLETYAKRTKDPDPANLLRLRLYDAVSRANGQSPSGIRFVTNRQ